MLLFFVLVLCAASYDSIGNITESSFVQAYTECSSTNGRFKKFNDVLSGRKNTVVGALLVWNRNLTPRDRAVKLCALATDSFYFLRGTNHMYYNDLYVLKNYDPRLTKFEEVTWIQGDLHSENFGSFDNSDNQVTFNVNDFDEAVVADFQYDLWRFSASLLLGLRAKNYSETQTNALIDSFLQGYFQSVALAAGGFEHGSYTADSVVEPMATFLNKVQDSNNRKKMLDKWAPVGPDGKRAFNYENSKGRLSAAPEHIVDLVVGKGFIEYYNSLTVISKAKYPMDQLKVKDVAARNLAGTGSLGAGRYYVLVEGPSPHQDDDMILDIKEQGRPAPFFYMGEKFMRNYTRNFGYNDAQRHNTGLLSLLRQVDPFLGYFREPRKNDTFSVRQRSPWKKSIEFLAYNYSDISVIVGQFGAMIGSDHSKASNQPIIHVNESRTYNFCPRDFAQRLAGKLKLTASIPARPQTSVESIEFSNLVKEVGNFYAHRTSCDYVIFREFARDVLDLKHCNILTLWEAHNETRAAPSSRRRSNNGSSAAFFGPIQAAASPYAFSTGSTVTSLVFAFIAGCAVTAGIFSSFLRHGAHDRVAYDLAHDQADYYTMIG